MNEVILLPYTEFPEDDVQNVLDIDATQVAGPGNEPPPAILPPPAPRPCPTTSTQRRSEAAVSCKQFALPRPADQAALACRRR